MRLAGLIAAAAALAVPAAAQNVDLRLNPGEALLRVEAEGHHRGRPDLMSLSAAVVTTGRTAREALAANSALAERLVAAVRANGVQPKDVQTSELTVSPQFERKGGDDEDDGPRRIIGYVARNELELTLRELSNAPAIIDALFQAGANEVRGPSFGYNDPAPAVKGARRAAVFAAREEAETYAEALQMRIVRILRLREGDISEPDENDNTIIVTGSRVRSTPIEPGEVTTTVTVWVDYAMVPR